MAGAAPEGRGSAHWRRPRCNATPATAGMQEGRGARFNRSCATAAADHGGVRCCIALVTLDSNRTLSKVVIMRNAYVSHVLHCPYGCSTLLKKAWTIIGNEQLINQSVSLM